MEKLKVSETLNLSIPERIQLVEDIWDTIAARADSIELTDEEKILVDDRLDAYHLKPDSGSSWEEVIERITGKKNV